MKITKEFLGKILFWEDKNKIRHPVLILYPHLGLTLKQAYLRNEKINNEVKRHFAELSKEDREQLINQLL
jgi:hypothetical protein